jgi:hypothetical protein
MPGICAGRKKRATFGRSTGWAPDPGPQGSVVGIVGAAFLVLTHLNALSAVLAPAIVQAFLPLTVFWSLRRPDVEAFFNP